MAVIVGAFNHVKAIWRQFNNRARAACFTKPAVYRFWYINVTPHIVYVYG
jgi:hypothetical protein